MEQFFNDVLKEITAGNPLELVEIINSDSSTPRTEGAVMAVDRNKKIWGTIGGGEIEFIAINESIDFIKNEISTQKKYALNNEIHSVNKTNMICGGNVLLKFTFLKNNQESIDYIDGLSKKLKDNSRYFIFGAGHVSLALSKILSFQGLNVVIYDDREALANHSRYEDKIKIFTREFDELDRVLDINENDYVVVMTNGHTNDYITVKKVLSNFNPCYIGCIGSEKKTKVLKQMLLDDGLDKNKISKIHAPIGIRIGAESVEEIAISIAAELILYRAIKENRRKILSNKSIFGRLDEYKV